MFSLRSLRTGRSRLWATALVDNFGFFTIPDYHANQYSTLSCGLSGVLRHEWLLLLLSVSSSRDAPVQVHERNRQAPGPNIDVLGSLICNHLGHDSVNLSQSKLGLASATELRRRFATQPFHVRLHKALTQNCKVLQTLQGRFRKQLEGRSHCSRPRPAI